MALSAASPGAAPRVTRGTAGRRLLQLVLMVGGLFLLGLLCGEQARAADGAGPAPAASTPATGAVHGTGGVHDLVRPVTGQVLRPVTEQVLRPVTGLVVPSAAEHVVRPVGDLLDRITEGLVEQPLLPLDPWAPPDLPGLPDAPEPPLPELPELPEVPAIPGQTLPADTTAPQQPDGPQADAPRPDGPQADAPRATGTQTREPRAAEERPAGTRSPGDGAAAAFGPRFPGGAGAADDTASRRPHPQASGVTRIAQAPAHQVPDGGPSGALRNHSAVDSGSPRHGDPQAVTPNERIRPVPVSGTAEDLTVAATRDRHRGVPASPG